MIDVVWLPVEGQAVLSYRFPPIWNWQDFALAQHQADALLDARQQTTPVFFDFTSGAYMPPGMLKQMQQIIIAWNPYGSPLIVVGGNRVIHNAFAVVARMLNASHRLGEVRFVNTIGAACTLIRSYTSEAR